MAVVWNWLLTADIRICSAEAQMALPETGLATVPGWSGTQRLTALLGRSLVKELVFTGEPLDAQRALSCGLVNRVVAREALHDAGLQLAQRIAQRAPAAVQIAKQVIDAGERYCCGLDALKHWLALFPPRLKMLMKAVRHFTEKRQPHFQAR